MSYRGNPSLSSAVRDRVESTFQQTLSLFKQGRREEVLAGCNLILQMDPMFDPARKLLDKTNNPSLPIDVDQLLPADDRSMLQQAREAMAARDFSSVIQITTEVLTNDLMNDEARVMSEEAREKLEAGPFVEQFIRKCDQQLAAGNAAGARATLEKARSLDATHPEVLRVTQALEGPAAGVPAARPAPDLSSSFVVETPAAPPRGNAQAADFGFTFEEEKAPAAFSFDAPSAPAAAPAAAPPAPPPAAPAETGFAGFSFDTPADSPFGGFSFGAPATPPAAAPPPLPKAPVTGEFDFATAAVNSSPEDQKKIEQLLGDGDRAFDSGDYQGAIDLWSRIFLVDVTNEIASARIDRAKAKRNEIEDRLETLLASAMASFDRGDTARARTEFSEVLRLDPQNAVAQAHLTRLNAQPAAPPPPPPPAFAPPPADNKIDLDFFEEEPAHQPSLGSLMPQEKAPPAAKTKVKAATSEAPAKGEGRRKLPLGLIGAVALAVLIVAGGWFGWTRFMSKPVDDTAGAQAIFARASALASAGRYEQAISVLQDIKPTDPQHDKALVMIADLQQKKSKSAQMIDGIPAAQYYDERIARGRAAIDGHDYAAAKQAFEEALRVKALPADAKALYDSAAQQVAKLDVAKQLFAERKFGDAITSLGPLLQQDPQNRNIERMIADAHFNLGATALQEERLADATREFNEVLKVDPSDELAKRSLALAQRYEGQPKDLLYRIYVKYLPLRQPS